MRQTTTWRAGAAACLLGALALGACDSGSPSAVADPGQSITTGEAARCANRANVIPRLLLECVTLEGVREHQAAFQTFADANGGNRYDGSAGFAASANYVAAALAAAGWSVTRQPVSYPRVVASLQQLSPVAATYPTGGYTGGGSGNVTAAVSAVDINLVPPRANTSGCEASDFAGFPAGNIALVQRGTCTFAVKALNAEAAGASAVVIFNQGDTPAREGLIVGTLGGADVVAIPVVGASFADGAALAQPGSTASVAVNTITVNSENVIAERAGRSGRVVMAGAALDSWPASPGINANGSGASVLLEIAQNLSNTRTDHTLRFAWWGGYSAGLLGSNTYVAGLSASDLDAIGLYLDVNVVGSPNFARFVLDGDGSTFPTSLAVPGSEVIESFFATFYSNRGLPSEPAAVTGGSDYSPFAQAGIPYGAPFSGATDIKTAAQAAIYGGTAGEQFDPCFALACDTYANVSLAALDQNADAAAAAILHFGMSAALPVRAGATAGLSGGPVVAIASE